MFRFSWIFTSHRGTADPPSPRAGGRVQSVGLALALLCVALAPAGCGSASVSGNDGGDGAGASADPATAAGDLGRASDAAGGDRGQVQADAGDPPLTCTHACPAAGRTACAGGHLQSCVLDANGCLVWSAPTKCAGGVCADAVSCGQCDNRCPAPGNTRCSAGAVQSCTADRFGCLFWTPPAACSAGFCADAASCGQCQNHCPAAGTTSCAGGELKTCVADANGCLSWTAPAACSAGFCADAASCGQCQNHCPTAGSTSCANGELRTCVADADGCLSWSAPATCSAGFCADAASCGQCNSQCPAAGTTSCADGELQTCVADANGCLSWSAPAACSAGFCADAASCGQCNSQCPAAGTTSCADGELRTCVADGHCLIWSSPTGCASQVCADPQTCCDCPAGYLCNASGGCEPAPSPPRLLGPISTALVTSRRPRLSFALSAGTTDAVVEVCPDRSCILPLMTLSGTSSVLPTADLPPGIVFWRAFGRKDGRVGTTPSTTWFFRVRDGHSSVDTGWGHVPDFDGDGLADIAISDWKAVRVYYGRRAATPQTTGTLPAAGNTFPDTLQAAGDIDGDGYGDFVVSGWWNDSYGTQHRCLRLYRGGSDGLTTARYGDICASGSESVGYLARGAGDVNRDGYGDLVTAAHAQFQNRVRVYWGGPQGLSQSSYLTLPGSYSVSSLQTADFNGDGRIDLAFTSSTVDDEVRVYWGNGSGFSATPTVLQRPESSAVSFGGLIAVGDVHRDGYADLAVTQHDATWIYRGTATGLSPTPTRHSAADGWITSIADLDADGFGDMVRGTYSAGLYPGSAQGLSATPTVSLTAATGMFSPRGAIVGDIDGDGFQDYVLGGGFQSPLAARLYVHLGGAAGPSTSADYTLPRPGGGYDDYGMKIATSE